MLLLCASCTHLSVDGPRHIECIALLDGTGLLDDTPHAPPPQTDASNQWVNFAVAEAGQLNKANKDKQITRQICSKVESLNDQAEKAAKKKTRRFLGLF